MATQLQIIREVTWIINEYLPPHLESIKSLLRTCQSACREGEVLGTGSVSTTETTGSSARNVVFPSATLVLSTVGTDALKGFVTLDGPKISKAEIQIHLPTWNKGHPVPIHLDPEHPTELPQISTCSTLIELAIQSVSRALESTQAPHVAKCLDDAIRYCRQAVITLENAENMHPMVHAVVTGAPGDLVLSFGVQNARIVAAAYISPQVSATAGTSTSSLRTLSRSSLPGHPLSTAPEMFVRVDSVVPALTAAHGILVHSAANLSGFCMQLKKILSLANSKPNTPT